MYVVVDRDSDRYEKTIIIGMTINQARELVAALQEDIGRESCPAASLSLAVGKSLPGNPVTGLCRTPEEARQI